MVISAKQLENGKKRLGGVPGLGCESLIPLVGALRHLFVYKEGGLATESFCLFVSANAGLARQVDWLTVP